MTSHERVSRDEESGLGLVEVIVALLVSSILLVAIGTILANSWVAQREVTNTTQATNRGQLIASAIERAVRNAEIIQVVDGSVLRVQTTLAGSMRCQGFRLVQGQPAQMTMSASALGDAAAWPEWEEGVRQRSGSGGSAIPFFTEWTGGTGVTYSFDMVEGDTAPVRFVGDVAKRNLSSEAGAVC